MQRGRKIATLMVATAVAMSIIVVPGGSANAAGTDPWVDTWDREAVLASYTAEFDRAEPDMGFTGDLDACVAGSTSQAHRDSVLQRINWYRRMAGLDTVRESATYTAANQDAVLIMAAEGNLSHYPASDWDCFNHAGSDAAAKSNLALGVGGVNAIDAYMMDPGANNTAAGHRRTMLYPQLQEVGIGDVPHTADNPAANAVHVFDAHLWDDRPAVREARDFVAWPPSGYVPAETVWGRWTFSLSGADFSAATVTVNGPDGPVAVEILERIQSQGGGRIAPEASIVWAVNGDPDSTPFVEPTDGDECYGITIAGVTLDGTPQTPFTYTSCVLDTDWTPTGPVFDGGQASGETVCPGRSFSAWDTPCWESATGGLPFHDVHTSWQLTPVGWLVANGITNGTTPVTFDPNGLVTRAQAATFIWRFAGSPTPPAGAPSFADVTADVYYHDAVRWMAANGITTGVTPGYFGPNRVATRAELVAFLWRLVDQPATGDASAFGDLTAGWQHGPVGWAAATGITTGTSATTFAPNDGVTRGQTAALLSRLADSLG